MTTEPHKKQETNKSPAFFVCPLGLSILESLQAGAW